MQKPKQEKYKRVLHPLARDQSSMRTAEITGRMRISKNTTKIKQIIFKSFFE